MLMLRVVSLALIVLVLPPRSAPADTGQDAAALDDLVDAMTLGRHVSMDGVLITVLLNYAIENRVGETLAPHLPGLEPELLKGLKSRLAGLPPAGTPARGLVPFEQEAG